MLETLLSCRNHPIDATPFEALYHGSWHGVDSLSIKQGIISAQINYRGSTVDDRIHCDYIRLRSRKATAFDCIHFLKPGIDVCVLSAHPTKENSEQRLQKNLLQWYDAKIISVKSACHNGRCTCLFSVMVYQSKAPTLFGKLSFERWAEVVTIDNLAVLQKLNSEACEDVFHKWSSSEDCTSSNKSKLLSGTGTFSSEISWLTVLSTLNGMDFIIKLMQNKVVHHFLNRESDVVDNRMKIMRFRKCDLKPKMISLAPVVPKETIPCKTLESDPFDTQLNNDSDVEILYDHVNLRHSRRRKMAPDRYIGNFSVNSVRRSLRNGKNGINRPEQQRTSEDKSSITSLFLDEESSPEASDCSLSRGSSKHMGSSSPAEVIQRKRKSTSEEKPSNFNSKQPIDIETLFVEQHKEMKIRTVKRARETSHLHNINHPFPRRERKRRSRKRKRLSAEEFERTIEMCMGNTMSEMQRETQNAAQWNEYQPVNIPEERLVFNWSPSSASEVENDEHEDLWKEMEYSLTALALQSNLESNFDTPAGSAKISNEDGHEPCQHDFKLDEKIGQVCQKCNYIYEIRYCLPSFLQIDSLDTWMEKSVIEEGWMRPNILDSDFSNGGSSWEMSDSEGYRNVWTLVPDLRSKLHLHQKNAFEFIWRNIAGSLRPEEMNHLSEDTGGCVISHSPGSGKTLLVISFLNSYLKLFPKVRPVILCPKIAVSVWCKEIEKWEFPFPVYEIYPAESYKREMWDGKIGIPATYDRKLKRREMHIMDCLWKFRKWHDHPSILLMSYTTFSSFAADDSNLNYRKFMAGILQKSPGILILDEGHNPRSSKSKMRKVLMKVNTKFRVLLSGTLFQNNFEEYFNTLSLARPCFIDDCISKLHPKMTTSENKKLVTQMNRREKLARKLFVERVGQQIESDKEDERKQGFELLSRSTSNFIDTYDGDTDTSEGLRIYTLMLTSSDLQEEVLNKLQGFIIPKRFPFEQELLITFGTIHPWLVKTVKKECAKRFLDDDELRRVENCKGNIGSGSKAKVVIDLVHKSTARGEKVLIFCHHISPIDLFVELFQSVFHWALGEEVLVLKGDQELSLRKTFMDKFNGSNNERCKVLLASTTACSEGISLVAASRVILLDSEWNHSKTRQAIARAFRPGQERTVYVYRLLASGTWEEEKFNMNTWKSWLAKMIFVGKYFEHSPSRQVEDIDDAVLKELVAEDSIKLYRRILMDEILK